MCDHHALNQILRLDIIIKRINIKAVNVKILKLYHNLKFNTSTINQLLMICK